MYPCASQHNPDEESCYNIGPGIFLSLLTCQEVSDTLCDLCKCYMLSICLLSLLKLLFHIIM